MEEGLTGLEAGEETTLAIRPRRRTASGARRSPGVRDRPPDRDAGRPDARRGGVPRGPERPAGGIVHVNEEFVSVDFNPRLAGETLEFEVEVVSVD